MQRKTLLISGFVLTSLIALLALMMWSLFGPKLNHDELRTLIRERAGIELRDSVVVREFTGSGLSIDISESYVLDISPLDCATALRQIHSGRGPAWILWRKGYMQYDTAPRNEDDYEYTFSLDSTDHTLLVMYVRH